VTRLETMIRDYAGPALCSVPPLRNVSAVADGQWALLLDALMIKNGFYAFESALHFYPLGEGGMDLVSWNEPSLWKSAYAKHDLSKLSCFAENVFGEQFCLSGGRFVKLDPETGDVEPVAETLEGWASEMLAEPNYHLGFSLAHAWQNKNGPLPPGMRLVPKRPFVCGGEFGLSNLEAMEAVKAMRMRGSIATQLVDLPDGASIVFELAS
jgi:hypothetical protein